VVTFIGLCMISCVVFLSKVTKNSWFSFQADTLKVGLNKQLIIHCVSNSVSFLSQNDHPLIIL
jgi:hypothetical protein